MVFLGSGVCSTEGVVSAGARSSLSLPIGLGPESLPAQECLGTGPGDA